MKSHDYKLNTYKLNTSKLNGPVQGNPKSSRTTSASVIRTKTALSAALLLTLGGSMHSAQADIADAEFASAMNKYLSTSTGTDAVGNTVEKYIKQQQELAKKTEQEAMFKDRVELEVGTSPVKGPANAPITIIEFSDFQCPYCSRGRAAMEELLGMEKFKGKIRLAFKNFPLDFHPQAKPAAIASLAAHKQGKFWEFHDELFANQGKLSSLKEGDAQASDNHMAEIAKKIGINVDKFKIDLKAPDILAQLKSDLEDAGKAGVKGTPFFLVNGVAVKGALPMSEFVPIIDRLLSEK